MGQLSRKARYQTRRGEKPAMNYVRHHLPALIFKALIAFFIYGAGVMTGIGYEGHLSQWSKNIDLSDYISMTVIILLTLALGLSLSRRK